MPPSPALTISGPPGSGTTTIAKLLRDELGLRYVYAGQIFRKKAEKMGMDLVDFGDYVGEHPEIDIELDQDMKEEILGGEVIVEGRVSGWLADHHSIPAFKVFLAASKAVRAQRVANREGKSMDVILSENREREEGERERYLDVYDFDVEDTGFYDLVIDTDDKTPAEIVKIILEQRGNG